MGVFYPGQKVVLARGLDLVSPAKSIGLQGIFCGYQFVPKGYVCADGSRTLIDSDCIVSWVDGSGECVQHSYQLEPLVPPHEACDDAEFTRSIIEMAERVKETA